MRARYYQPQTARFFSLEPIWPILDEPKLLNPYQYSLNNPLAFVDPEGDFVFAVFAILGVVALDVGGALVGVAISDWYAEAEATEQSRKANELIDRIVNESEEHYRRLRESSQRSAREQDQARAALEEARRRRQAEDKIEPPEDGAHQAPVISEGETSSPQTKSVKIRGLVTGPLSAYSTGPAVQPQVKGTQTTQPDWDRVNKLRAELAYRNRLAGYDENFFAWHQLSGGGEGGIMRLGDLETISEEIERIERLLETPGLKPYASCGWPFVAP
jgi:hypothetical protein